MRTKSAWLFVTGLLAILCMAPTAGDIGGCGATIAALDPAAYAFERKDLDCRRCQECALTTPRCARACDATKSPDVSVPSTCKPVKHDGEVCIRALEAASCDDYASYVAEAPTSPSECQFCQYVPPGPLPGFQVDASTAEDGSVP